MRWADDQVFHLTKADNVEPVPVTDAKVRLFPTAHAAQQYLRHAFGVKCDLYPAYVRNAVLLEEV